MSLISLIIVIALVGLLLWFVGAYIPMDPTVRRILQGVVILVLILWLLQAFGILGNIGSVTVPRLN